MDRLKGMDNVALKEIMRDQKRGKLERGCAKKTLEIRQETAKAEQDNKKESTDASDKETPTVFNNLEDMKKDLGKTYSEIKEDKPPNSPNISKWFEKGGTIKVEQTDGKMFGHIRTPKENLSGTLTGKWNSLQRPNILLSAI